MTRATFRPGDGQRRPLVTFVQKGEDLLDVAHRRTVETIRTLESRLRFPWNLLPGSMTTSDMTDFTGPGIGMKVRGGTAIHSIKIDVLGRKAQRMNLLVQKRNKRAIVLESSYAGKRKGLDIDLDPVAPREAALRLARIHLDVIEAAMLPPRDTTEMRAVEEAIASMLKGDARGVELPTPTTGPALVGYDDATNQVVSQYGIDNPSLPQFARLHIVGADPEKHLCIHMAAPLVTTFAEPVDAMRTIARLRQEGPNR